MSKKIKALFGDEKLHCLMLGLDVTGKTTILYKLQLGEIGPTIPTKGEFFLLDLLIKIASLKRLIRLPGQFILLCSVGFHIETLKYKNSKVTGFGAGGDTFWSHQDKTFYATADFS